MALPICGLWKAAHLLDRADRGRREQGEAWQPLITPTKEHTPFWHSNPPMNRELCRDDCILLAGLKYNHFVQPYSQSQIIIYSHLAGYNTLKVIRSSQSIISSQCGCGCLSVWLDLILLKNSVQPLHCDWSIGSALNRFLAISQPQ